MSQPDSAENPTARGEALLAGGRPDEAVAAFTAALALRPKDSAAWRGLGKAQLDLGDQNAAKISFARALAIVPYDRYAAHMLASLSGPADVQATGYVADLFDTYADDFDAHLTGDLNYRIPQAIRALLAERAPFASLLDLGCGTGLVGAALSDLVATIHGIDIAPRMTRKAHERGLYRHLRTGDLLDSIANDPALVGPYDLVTAADVFVYLGPLEAIFAATATLLVPQGLLVFSVETTAGDAPVLRSSGRFAHPAAYIARLADQFGFTLDVTQSRPIRQERDQPIPGALYLLTRN
ncbi:methyltransferase domain-containing protein [Devosia beringensis]|uniref:methyltransferase domain-containing protein n=1 Tax=Devosia beringensis TaxID=2657486 RepID=UPI00186BA8A6|nr:methyltransferase domain-containing protein [Devosia beringensis]